MKKFIRFFALGSILLQACNTSNDYEQVFKNPLLYSKITDQLTEVITYDIFTPPVASRIYAYGHLAAYEVIAHNNPKYNTLDGQIKDWKQVPAPPAEQPIQYQFAAALALMQVGEALTFSKETTAAIIDSLHRLAKDHGMPADMYNNSVQYADTVARHVLAWSKKDNYAQTRSATKYTIPNDEGKWVPTPPGYFQAVEPHWRTIRTIVMDSAEQFIAPPPPDFSKDTNSAFYKGVQEVYLTGKNLTEEQAAIANFWDCNGFKMNVAGHVMFATKAMTPGGHWMGITGIIAKNKNVDFDETVYNYTTVSFAVMDAFISCWDMKYEWNLIRPETFINRYMDEDWKPLLQTPPFPEYTSGHAIISTAAASVLTTIYGDNTPFRDTTERAWGWPDREFKSPREAAKEAGISRFYGGIHYRNSIIKAEEQGEKIGQLVMTKLKMKK
ncbi:MAG: vanadium-dependent haloperoxidase [Chitinophagaceae bacterium]|nr:vanadium-dependent haloperoxidase [Chitinophagaceae bacterium]